MPDKKEKERMADTFDVRTVERKIAAGVFSEKDYKKALGDLPDSGDNAEFVPIDEDENPQPPAETEAAEAEAGDEAEAEESE